MDKKYVRCSECAYIYSLELDKCPKCKTITPITEENEQKDITLFNICD